MAWSSPALDALLIRFSHCAQMRTRLISTSFSLVILSRLKCGIDRTVLNDDFQTHSGFTFGPSLHSAVANLVRGVET